MFKRIIYDGGYWLGANDANAKTLTAYKYKLREWGFLNVLARERHAHSSSKTFKYIHLSIPHSPNAMNSDCSLRSRVTNFRIGRVEDFMTESGCALNEIGVLLAWLKDNNIYDNTKIVIVSDHGWWVDNPMFPIGLLWGVPKGYQSRMSTGWVQGLMLVKDFGAKGPLSRSDTFLSNADVPAIVCSAIGSCPGVDPNPITNPVEGRSLIVTTTTQPTDWEENTKFDIKESYEVTGSIFKASNWKRIQ